MAINRAGNSLRRALASQIDWLPNWTCYCFWGRPTGRRPTEEALNGRPITNSVRRARRSFARLAHQAAGAANQSADPIGSDLHDNLSRPVGFCSSWAANFNGSARAAAQIVTCSFGWPRAHRLAGRQANVYQLPPTESVGRADALLSLSSCSQWEPSARRTRTHTKTQTKTGKDEDDKHTALAGFGANEARRTGPTLEPSAAAAGPSQLLAADECAGRASQSVGWLAPAKPPPAAARRAGLCLASADKLMRSADWPPDDWLIDFKATCIHLARADRSSCSRREVNI